jgi:hypothetical protein
MHTEGVWSGRGIGTSKGIHYRWKDGCIGRGQASSRGLENADKNVVQEQAPALILVALVSLDAPQRDSRKLI